MKFAATQISNIELPQTHIKQRKKGAILQKTTLPPQFNRIYDRCDGKINRQMVYFYSVKRKQRKLTLS